MKKIKNNKKAFLMILLASFFGGALPVYVKIGLKEISPFTYIFLRFFLTSIFFFPFLYKLKSYLKKDFLKIILISGLSTLNIVLFSFGVRLTAASFAQMIYLSVPILVAIFSYFLLKEKINKQKIIGIFLGFIGNFLIVVFPVIFQLNNFKASFLGNLLIFIGAISYSFYQIFSKKIQNKFSPIEITAIFSLTTMFISFIFMFGELFFLKNIVNTFSFQSFFSLFYVSFFGSFVYYLLTQYAIKFGSPLIASMVLYLQPVFTIFWAFFLLKEKISLSFIFISILSLLGAWFVSFSK